uniref:Acyl-coenzyme A dehydrogenase n=1 Tax=Hanusia phi TaxID=3032 RepID=A0A7S0ESF2_9CRYP
MLQGPRKGAVALSAQGARVFYANAIFKLQKRGFIGPAYTLAKNVMPKISETEAAALNSGSVCFDRELFEGNPSTKRLLEKYKIKISPEEQAFIENETEALCEMLDSHQIDKDQNLPPEVWNYIRENKFMGMIIPKKFGGLGFSGHGHARVVEKIAGRNGAAAVTVMVPNSLGPGELLFHYGTPEQQNFYLPRLAHGIDIPCFGLTGAPNGSDAAGSMQDEGVVVQENGVLGMRVSFNKRYITLAPVATVVGLAFKLRDPNKLLTKGKEGITVALLPTEPNQFAPEGIKGLKVGPRHNPLNAAFMNGTVQGENVFIPMSCVIGGEAKTGYGWNMLVECLGEGRGISLPAMAVSSGRLSCLAVGGYARVRKQFKVPIANMEGVQEKLAVIVRNTYQCVAGQHLFDAILADGDKPPVLSAIMKQYCTERGREAVNEAMDVIGGSGIIKGPSNYLATAYCAMPIAITVEGANALTRSLIIFGQGLNRSHPHLLKLIESIQKGDDIIGFNQELKNIIVHAMSNLGSSIARGLSVQFQPKGNDIAGYYEAQMSRLAANFAFCSDVGMTMGGGLKTAEYISGRYADILSNLYIGYACLWYYQNHKNVKGLSKVLDIAMADCCYKIQEAFFGIFSNFPIPGLGPMMRVLTFPRGREYFQAKDSLRRDVSNLITTPTEVRALLTDNVFVSKKESDRVNQIARAVTLAFEADNVLSACRKEKREPRDEEQKLISAAEELRDKIIQVDTFEAIGKEHRGGFMTPTWTVAKLEKAEQ